MRNKKTPIQHDRSFSLRIPENPAVLFLSLSREFWKLFVYTWNRYTLRIHRYPLCTPVTAALLHIRSNMGRSSAAGRRSPPPADRRRRPAPPPAGEPRAGWRPYGRPRRRDAAARQRFGGSARLLAGAQQTIWAHSGASRAAQAAVSLSLSIPITMVSPPCGRCRRRVAAKAATPCGLCAPSTSTSGSGRSTSCRPGRKAPDSPPRPLPR